MPSQSPSVTAPPKGEPLAKRRSFPVCQGLPSVGATATTAASGGNREELLGPRPAGCKRQRSRRWVPQPGQWQCEAMTERLSPARASRSGRPSSNLSVGLAPASSPSRGASGEEAKLCGMPRPPLGRSNGDDRRQWRKQGGAVGAAASRMQATAKQTLGAATRAVAMRSNDGEVESSKSLTVRPSFVQPLSRACARQLP